MKDVMKKRKKKIDVLSLAIFIFLFVQLTLLVVPFIWCFITSFKGNLDYYENPFGLPKLWKWERYPELLRIIKVPITNKRLGVKQNVYFGQMVFNSFAYAGVSAFTATTVCYIVAYIRNSYDFKILHGLDLVVLFVTTMPIIGSLPASITVFTKLGLIENFFGMTVIAKASFTSTYYFIIGVVIKGISGSYIEAAQIDGANQVQLFTRIMVPLTISMYFTIFLFNFVGAWNDYTTPMIYLTSFPTASYGLWELKQVSTREIDGVPVKLASTFLTVAPVLILFTIFSSRIMNGLNFEGGEKG